ncbi:uncharacterized protein EAE97_011867 [Botrytis byssoidea]|uniref:F-box domain-containing protein n=1 Tax=Botrytis byssoidea TaxID=139641 RepID=A0A9P5HS54_9HELO|nr:uncharacterized protein EAE97_011867 [Botrytis byssoidea]KAF7918412.1 hypothetical protein EAE97_011867 [Botrytis byssoidea]
MSASLSSLRQSSSPSGVFRFLDLPSEIRNKIYDMATCDIEDPEPLDNPDKISLNVFKNNLNTNLFLTCRQIHDEAKYVMMTKNLFVEVQLSGVGRRLNNEFKHMLSLYRVPVVSIKEDIDPEERSFDGCVVRYRVSCDEQRSVWERDSIDALVISHRHMNQFLEAIHQTQWFISTCTKTRSYHDITLQNPFVSRSTHVGDSRSHSRFSIEALQNKEEALLSPFSTIKEGPTYISKDWSGSYVQHDKTRPPVVSSITTESVLEDLEMLIRKGRDHHLRGIYLYAEEFYKLTDYKISVLMSSLRNTTVTKLFEMEGLDPDDQLAEREHFEDELAEIYSTVCYRRAENALADMRRLVDNGLGQHSRDACDIIHKMASQGRAPLSFPFFVPNPERIADHIFMEAVSFRLWEEVRRGDRWSIDKALEKVESGLEMAPNHPGLKAEKYRIVRRRVESILDFSIVLNVAHPPLFAEST